MEFIYADKPGEYVFASAYVGTLHNRDSYLVGRVAKNKMADLAVGDWSFRQPDGTWGTLNTAGRFPNTSNLGLDGANWKTMNSYAEDLDEFGESKAV